MRFTDDDLPPLIGDHLESFELEVDVLSLVAPESATCRNCGAVADTRPVPAMTDAGVPAAIQMCEPCQIEFTESEVETYRQELDAENEARLAGLDESDAVNRPDPVAEQEGTPTDVPVEGEDASG